MTSTLRVNTIQNTNTSTLITQTNATTITLGYSSATIAIASGATQTGFGRTGTVDWDTTPKTTTVTAVSGVGYFVNTTSGAITVNLPVGVAGAIVSISDYANTAATNNIIVTPNGTDKIDGVNGIYPFATNGASITFVYVDATRGWKDVGDATLNAAGIPPFVVATGGTILTCGDFKTHVFTGPGTFTVTNAGGPAGSNSVEYLTVAGGAGGGARYGGGGGAGGFRQNYPSPATAGLPVTAQAYPITVGGGGNGGNSPRFGVSGNPSIFSTITSAGGGGGGGEAPAPTGGLTGASGGGGAYNGTGGAGNTPPVSPPQGNTGGDGGQIAPTVSFGGGGGGGAAAVGAKAVAGGGGAGGIGSPIATTVFGPTSPSYGTAGPAPGRYFAGGGGGGGGQEGGPSGGAGGSGGGGAGGPSSNPGTAATVNTGGGGGGGFGASCTRTGGNGGSGIVVIRYKFQ